jgi:thymidylate synthase ThyX
MQSVYCTAMDHSREIYQILAGYNPEVAAYVVPNGFNRRVLVSLNLRSAIHLLSLRSASNAHFSMRRIARRMSEQIKKVYPLLGEFLRLEPGETWQEIETNYFHRTM